MKLLRIHLRDFFWLLLVVAMGLGWWIEHVKILEFRRNMVNFWHEEEYRMAREIQKANARVLEMQVLEAQKERNSHKPWSRRSGNYFKRYHNPAFVLIDSGGSSRLP